MASVCFYFQVHQPFRLRQYSVFDVDHHYFDDNKNAEICRKVTNKCYLPANKVMLDLIRMHEGRFRVAYSLSGVVLEQFEQYAPEVLEPLAALQVQRQAFQTAEASRLLNMSPNTVRKHLQRLVASGVLKPVGRGRAARYRREPARRQPPRGGFAADARRHLAAPGPASARAAPCSGLHLLGPARSDRPGHTDLPGTV